MAVAVLDLLGLKVEGGSAGGASGEGGNHFVDVGFRGGEVFAEEAGLLGVVLVGGDYDFVGDGLGDVSLADEIVHQGFHGCPVVHRVRQKRDHPSKNDQKQRAYYHKHKHYKPFARLSLLILTFLLLKHHFGRFCMFCPSEID